MAEVLALPLLFDAMKALILVDQPTCSVVFGRKEVYKQINQGAGGGNRIVFAPGNLTNVFADELPAHGIGRDPRPLATEDEFFTCWIWAYDGSAPEDERKQYTAARLLFDIWRKAFYRATHTDGDSGIGPAKVLAGEWNRTRLERKYGDEIIVSCSVQAMVPDDDGYQIVDPPLHSHGTLTELTKSGTWDT